MAAVLSDDPVYFISTKTGGSDDPWATPKKQPILLSSIHFLSLQSSKCLERLEVTKYAGIKRRSEVDHFQGLCGITARTVQN